MHFQESNIKIFPWTPLEAQAFGPLVYTGNCLLYHENPPTTKLNETPGNIFFHHSWSKFGLSLWHHQLANLHILKTGVSLEQKEIFDNDKQESSSRTEYLFIFSNGLGRKDANFVTLTETTNLKVWRSLSQNKSPHFETLQMNASQLAYMQTCLHFVNLPKVQRQAFYLTKVTEKIRDEWRMNLALRLTVQTILETQVEEVACRTTMKDVIISC